MKQKYKFFWQKDGLNIHDLPIQIKRSSTSPRPQSGRLMCDHCYEESRDIRKMTQLYKCERCESEVKIKDIDNRYMDLDGEYIVYTKHELSEYTKRTTKDTIKVLREISTINLPYVAPLISSDYELFCNDEKVIPVVKKIHMYLLSKNIMLLGRLDNKAVLIFASLDSLCLHTLRDKRTIKPTEQLGLTKYSISDDVTMIYEASVTDEIDTFEKFKDYKVSGVPLPIIIKKKKEDSTDFVDDLSALEVLC